MKASPLSATLGIGLFLAVAPPAAAQAPDAQERAARTPATQGADAQGPAAQAASAQTPAAVQTLSPTNVSLEAPSAKSKAPSAESKARSAESTSGSADGPYLEVVSGGEAVSENEAPRTATILRPGESVRSSKSVFRFGFQAASGSDLYQSSAARLAILQSGVPGVAPVQVPRVWSSRAVPNGCPR